MTGARRTPVLIWILIICGVGVIAGAFAFRNVATTTSRTVDRTDGRPVKVSTTEKPLSDSVLLALSGIGTILVLAGAFHTRINKVSFPGGGGIELGVAPVEAAEAVARALHRLPADALPDSPEVVAAQTAAATTLTATRGLAIAQLAGADASLHGPLAALPEVGADIARVTQEGLLDEGLWDRLAEASLAEVLKRSGQAEGDLGSD